MKIKALMTTVAAVAAITAGAAGAANAAVFAVTGTSGGNPVSAEALVTVGFGTLSIDVTNTIANFSRSSQAIRGIEIDFLIDPTSVLTFTADGQLATISTVNNPDTATPVAGEPTRWDDTLSGGLLILDIGGTQPKHMISGNIPLGNANTGVGNFNPYVLGTGFFDLTFAPDFFPQVTSIAFRFGTGPEAIISTPCDRDCDGLTPPLGIPEPATWGMMLMGFFGIGSAVRASRRRVALAA